MSCLQVRWSGQALGCWEWRFNLWWSRNGVGADGGGAGGGGKKGE